MIPPFCGDLEWSSADPANYSHVVFVCGPFRTGSPLTEFVEHFAGCRLVGVNVSMLEPIEIWNPFDSLLERDSLRTGRPDVTFLSRQLCAPRRSIDITDDSDRIVCTLPLTETLQSQSCRFAAPTQPILFLAASARDSSSVRSSQASTVGGQPGDQPRGVLLQSIRVHRHVEGMPCLPEPQAHHILGEQITRRGVPDLETEPARHQDSHSMLSR